MRKIACLSMICIALVSCMYVNATAINKTTIPSYVFDKKDSAIVLASGSFSMSISPYGKSEANKTFPLEAGETVNISAVYSPNTASMDFGLVDSEGVFHYFTVTDGSVDKTIQVLESGNYTFAIRNNSGMTVKVSGFVRY